MTFIILRHCYVMIKIKAYKDIAGRTSLIVNTSVSYLRTEITLTISSNFIHSHCDVTLILALIAPPTLLVLLKKQATAKCGVVPMQKQGCAKRLAIKESFDDVINSPSEWYQLLRKVIDPIKERLENNQASKSTDLVVTKKDKDIAR